MVFQQSGLLTRIAIAGFLLNSISQANAAEWLIESRVDARAEYDDNIFITDLEHDSVTGIIITPSIDGVVKEEHWKAQLEARLRSNNYSDHDLNSNDKYLDITGSYNAERNIFSLNANYDLDSNLNSTSDDFGIVGRRINRKNQSITPQYTRLLTERMALVASYSYSDVEYIDAENTGFTPYIAQTGSASLIYNLTENDKLTLSLQGVDYNSKNDLVTYTLFTSRFGIAHAFSETLSTDFLAGVSRRNSTNLVSTSFDFFGNIITQTQEVDFSDRGFVLDAGIKQLYESGQLEGRISRDNTTNSFGGLNRVDQLKVNFSHRLSSLWRYRVNGRYEDVTAISSGTRSTDRKVLFLETVMSYNLDEYWSVNGSYRYIQRKFKNTSTNNKAPHSNRIYLGLTYNFPDLSTF